MLTLAEFQAFEKRIEKLLRSLENRCTNFGMKERWLDNQEVKQLLRISPRTLQSYRDKGILPFSKLGGKFFYRASDVEKLLEQNLSVQP